MQILHVASHHDLRTASAFDDAMEPLLQRLEAAGRAGHPLVATKLCQDYLQVCRWPFRQLEYAYALEAIARTGKGPGRALDAGSGITPFGHALAARGWDVTACDFDGSLMRDLAAADMAAVYGSAVRYEQQDLTRITYPDASFDLVTCVSVIEHIGAPADQLAFAELRRVLKPGGLLVVTVDFEPAFSHGSTESRRVGRRLKELATRGDVAGLASAVGRKVRAWGSVAAGSAAHARTPNQCFQIAHLVDDVAPGMTPGLEPLDVPFAHPLDAVDAEAVEAFWNLVPGLFDVQGRRIVLPAALRYVKPS